MKKLDLDLSIVSSITILAMVFWSNATSKTMSICIVIALLVFLFSYNLFMLFVRNSEKRLLRVFHSTMFYLFGILIFGFLLMDDHSFSMGVLYLLVHSLYFLIAYVLLCEDRWQRKLLVFGVSCLVLMISLLTIV